ncbi:peptide chain release factor 1 [Desulfarculus baarsii]
MAMSPDLKARLEEVEARFNAVERELADPNIVANQENFMKRSKEHAELSQLVECFRSYNKYEQELGQNRLLMADDDEELAALAGVEVEQAETALVDLEQRMRLLLLPQDPRDEKNVVLEIRAGTGGDEAALFAAELLRMYLRYAELKRWKTEILSQHPTNAGGFKEVIALITGRGAYSQLKYESGAHRVQRVPATESQGRVHTSAVTVAVLPEADEVEVDIKPEELRIDYFRSSGPGGQHVNTTDSAVRITHLPTGLVVSCQDEKSQHKNKAKALKVLAARLLEKMEQEQQAALAANRRSQVGSGDRSERIRTYNFPQGRVTDHRIGLTIYKLEEVLVGELELIIPHLVAYFQAEALKSSAA